MWPVALVYGVTLKSLIDPHLDFPVPLSPMISIFRFTLSILSLSRAAGQISKRSDNKGSDELGGKGLTAKSETLVTHAHQLVLLP